jgi:hypothetical protein
MTTSRRLFKFSAPGNELTPEPSPERKPNPEVVTSGESDFESAKGSPALTGLRESPAYEQTGLEEELNPLIESLDEGRPRYDTGSERAALAEEPTHYLLANPKEELDLDPLVESSYFTNPARTNLYTLLSKIFFPLSKHLTNPFQFI